jgi:hypothetical protein
MCLENQHYMDNANMCHLDELYLDLLEPQVQQP